MVPSRHPGGVSPGEGTTTMRLPRTRRAAAVALATAGLCLTTLAPFSATTANAVDSNDATLQYQRGQSFVALDPGGSGSFDAVCPAGYYAVNGGFQLDGGSTHTSRDTCVMASWAVAGVDVDPGAGVDTREVWRVEVDNASEERITGRVNAACLGGTTEGSDKHPVTVTDTGWAVSTTTEDGNGYFTQASDSCGSAIPVGSMYRVDQPALQVAATTDGTSWTLSFESYAATNELWVSSRCLATTTGTVGGHYTLVQKVTPDPATKSGTIANATSGEINAVCPSGSLALAGEFYKAGGNPVESGVIPLGGEPRSEAVSQRFYNDSGASADVTTSAICVKGAVIPPAQQVVGATNIVRNGAGTRVLADVSCTLGCGTVTGKLYVKTGPTTLGSQVAFGKVVLGNATSGALRLRVKSTIGNLGGGSYTLVLSGRGFSDKRFDVTF